jgi:hypothetical protein
VTRVASDRYFAARHKPSDLAMITFKDPSGTVLNLPEDLREQLRKVDERA